MKNRLKEFGSVSIHAEDESAAPGAADVAAIAGEAQDWLANAVGEIEQFVTDRPALALSAALVVGVFLGWLIKRR